MMGSLDRLPGFRRVRGLLDTAIGSRPERQIVSEAIERFTDELVGPVGDYVSIEAWEQARRQAGGIIGYWDDQMRSLVTGFGPFSMQKYRRRSTVPGSMLTKWADDYATPYEWYKRYKDRVGPEAHEPVAQAWLKADNRIRAYFRGRDGGLAEQWAFIDKAYDSRFGRKLAGINRALSAWYFTFRFAYEIRWLGLQATEGFALTISKEGYAAVMNAHGFYHKPEGGWARGTPSRSPFGVIEEATPLGYGVAALDAAREDWPWWLQQVETPMSIKRLAYIQSTVKNLQDARLPRVAMEIAGSYPQLMDLLAHLGKTPQEWLYDISAAWNYQTTAARLQRVMNPQEAAEVYRPWLRDGTISQAEFDTAVAEGRHTPDSAIQKAIDVAMDPVLKPLLQRVAFLNDQFWADTAKLHFGQADRSNLQRLVNHPLLWWPAGYMINATKWLAGILLERMGGRDTGMAGAFTLAQIHQRHAELWDSDPEYRQFFADHPTLIFLVEMLIPLTPYGWGVSLSPMTRGLLAVGEEWVTGKESAYRRGIFDVGPIVTLGSTIPRLIHEERLAGGDTWYGRFWNGAENIFPIKYTAGDSSSRLAQAEQRAVRGAQVYDPLRVVDPDNKYVP